MPEIPVYHGRRSYKTITSIIDDGAIRSQARRSGTDPDILAAAEGEIDRWLEEGYRGRLHDQLDPAIQETCGVATVEDLFDEYGVWIGNSEDDGKMYATRVGDDGVQQAGGYMELAMPVDDVAFSGSYGVTAGEIPLERAERIVLHSYNGQYACDALEERVRKNGMTVDVELSPMQLSIVENATSAAD